MTEQYVPSTALPRAWLVDIDGTLAHMSGRKPYMWDRVGEDTPAEAVIQVVKALAAFAEFVEPLRIVVMSGRDEVCRPQTESWLNTHVPVWHELHMRAHKDNRKDSIVKAELFDRHVRDRFWVQGVLDDRNQVVEMWRAMGLVCLQVAPGDF